MITYEKRTKQNLGIKLKKQEVEWCELCVVFCVKGACNNYKVCIALLYILQNITVFCNTLLYYLYFLK